MSDNGRAGKEKAPALDALQAVLLMTKHLDTLLPFLMLLSRVPVHIPQRIGVLQVMAREIAADPELARDWYRALELLTGRDLSASSVAELLQLAVSESSSARLGDVWGVAFQIGLIDEGMFQRWVAYASLSAPESKAGKAAETTKAVQADGGGRE